MDSRTDTETSRQLCHRMIIFSIRKCAPEEQTLFPDLEAAAAVLLASFREAVGTDTDDPRFIELVGELSLASPLFRRLWARHDVRSAHDVTLRLRHPRVGALELLVEKFQVVGASGLETLLLHAEPGTPSADALALLATLDVPS